MNPASRNILPLLLAFLFLGFISIACEENTNVQPGNPVAFPDFSDCNCDTDSVNVVCTTEGKWFRTDCFSNCLGISPLADTISDCPDSVINPLDTLTWPIQLVCHPVLPSPPIVARLSDSTFIFQVDDSTFIRGIPFGMCRCLPAETLIATPLGQKPISQLKLGDRIFTKDMLGKRITQPIVQLNRVPVGQNHKILQLTLADGREIRLTPGHPGTKDEGLDKLEIGDILDGSQIIYKVVKPFNGKETWDLLPAGTTGFYQANGIWIGSTLKQKIPVYTPPVSE